MLAGVMPPTGRIGTFGGKIAFIAFRTGGGLASAGNSFSASAPAAIAAKPSVGVAMPGRQESFAALARRMMAVSPCGMTMRRPPAETTSPTCRSDVTVPAPMSAAAPKRCARRSTLASGCGELSGTSMMAKPASMSAAPAASASSGRMPRRIATSGQRPSHAPRSAMSASLRQMRGEAIEAPRDAIGIENARFPAGGGERVRIEPGKSRLGDDVNDAALARQEIGELAPDEDAREIGRKRCWRDLAEEGAAAHAEEVMEQPARVAGAREPGIEGGVGGDRGGSALGRHQPAENAVPAQHGKRLAGHRRGEIQDTAAVEAHPFAVRSRQAQK